MNDTRSRSKEKKRNRKKVHTQMYNMDGVRHALYEQSKAGMNFNNLLAQLELNRKQLKKLNELRVKYGTEVISA